MANASESNETKLKLGSQMTSEISLDNSLRELNLSEEKGKTIVKNKKVLTFNLTQKLGN